jgi:hypothetical protein
MTKADYEWEHKPSKNTPHQLCVECKVYDGIFSCLSSCETLKNRK